MLKTNLPPPPFLTLSSPLLLPRTLLSLPYDLVDIHTYISHTCIPFGSRALYAITVLASSATDDERVREREIERKRERKTE